MGDYDGSGRPSLLVSTYENETHALYRNDGGSGMCLFRHRSSAAGLAVLNHARVGWGAAFLDIDNDGKLDLVIAESPGRERGQPRILLNKGKYTLLQPRDGGRYFQQPHHARGVAVVDLDNDGLIDLTESHAGVGENSGPTFYRADCRRWF